MNEKSLGKQFSESELNSCIELFDTKLKELPQYDIETTHHFSNGVYVREIKIPAGVVLVGKRHKKEHLNIISQGEIVVLTSEGIKTITAPATIKSEPGIKRVGYALQDTVWSTIHPNPENIENLDDLEQLFIVDDSINIETEGNTCLG